MIWTEEEYAAYLKKRGKPAPKIRRSKYNAKRTNGYDSAHEAQVAGELHMREKAERVKVLEQVPFPLMGCSYVADFVLLYPNGRYEVVDAKGFKTDVYKLKKKMFLELWGVEIQEV